MQPVTNPNLAATPRPPVMEARRWLDEVPLPAGRALLNLSQAAPVDPPPERLRQAMAAALSDGGEVHLYGAVLGEPALRARIAADWSRIYAADLAPEHVAVTAGCNQAFCAAVATLCAPGDAVILPVPWYFNHQMWLAMSGLQAIPVPCDQAMLPDLGALRTAIASAAGRVRAVAMVSPNNPTGVEYPPALLEAAFELCREAGIALILDETYRDFHASPGPPHGLFSRAGWEETLLHLYSFSKVFRLTGHRTGALLAGPARLAEAEKFLDTVTICPPRTGQVAALEGLDHLGAWVAAERDEILARRAAVAARIAELPGWRLRGVGAYFAWVEVDTTPGSHALARRLLAEQAVLVLPGAMFCPGARDPDGPPALRIAFANADAEGIAEMGRRFAEIAL